MCTFEGCKTGDKSYASYSAWSRHEAKRHRLDFQYRCPVTSGGCAEQSDQKTLRQHLVHVHRWQQWQLADIDYRRLEMPDANDYTDFCSFCASTLTSEDAIVERHVARHLEEVALVVLAKPYDEGAVVEDGVTLFSYGHSMSTWDVGAIIEAWEKLDLEAIKSFEEEGHYVLSFVDSPTEVLTKAVKLGKMAMVHFLLGNGVEISEEAISAAQNGGNQNNAQFLASKLHKQKRGSSESRPNSL